MPTRNVDLTEHYENFIAAGVEAGRYSDASEAVRAGLRLLEQQELEDLAKLDWLRGATREAFDALDRGEGVPLKASADIDAFVDEIIAESRAARRLIHA